MNNPTPADALRGLLAVMPLYMLHDPAVVEAVKQARESLHDPVRTAFDKLVDMPPALRVEPDYDNDFSP